MMAQIFHLVFRLVNLFPYFINFFQPSGNLKQLHSVYNTYSDNKRSTDTKQCQHKVGDTYYVLMYPEQGYNA